MDSGVPAGPCACSGCRVGFRCALWGALRGSGARRCPGLTCVGEVQQAGALGHGVLGVAEELPRHPTQDHVVGQADLEGCGEAAQPCSPATAPAQHLPTCRPSHAQAPFPPPRAPRGLPPPAPPACIHRASPLGPSWLGTALLSPGLLACFRWGFWTTVDPPGGEASCHRPNGGTRTPVLQPSPQGHGVCVCARGGAGLLSSGTPPMRHVCTGPGQFRTSGCSIGLGPLPPLLCQVYPTQYPAPTSLPSWERPPQSVARSAPTGMLPRGSPCTSASGTP